MKIRFRLEKYPGFAPNTRAHEFDAHLYLNDAMRSFGEAKLWRNMYESEIRNSVSTVRSWLLDLTNQGPLFKAGFPSEDEMLVALREAAEAFDPEFAATIAWPKLQPVQTASTTTNPVNVDGKEYLTFGELNPGERFISVPKPGDNSGHGGFRQGEYIFTKTQPSSDRINAIRNMDGVLTSMPDTMPIIRIL